VDATATLVDVLLTVRLPPATRARIRALSAVTGLSLQEVVIAAFTAYYRRLPRTLRRQIERVGAARLRYRRE
jgi:hypothetical protein